MNATTYSFNMPKSGTFTIKATGKCDPSKSKSYTVEVKAVEPEKPTTPIPTLILTEQDIHDIIKVTSTEVDMRVKNEEERKHQARGVIDTILNRVYLDENKNVRNVLNKKGQFSAVSGNAKSFGSVQKIPDTEIKPWTAKFTEEYLIQRTKTEKSSIGGNFNYLNPNKTGQNIMLQWGNDVVAQAEKSGLIFGEGIFIHYHGTAKGERQAPPLKVKLPSNYQPKWSKS